jgi:16S rRNA (guanine527-N7)-methyltransferase
MRLIRAYFPELSPGQEHHFQLLMEILPRFNQQVNVVSRKDIGSLEERHILHSLAIAKKFSFHQECTVIDAGTGGGFPGLPLAILYPDARFILVDSIRKKIGLVREVAARLGLQNVTAVHSRVEELPLKADFVVSRAVAPFHQLFQWTDRLIRPGHSPEMANGLISLKGGDLEAELHSFLDRVEIYAISDWFAEPFFSTKKIVYLKK